MDTFTIRQAEPRDAEQITKIWSDNSASALGFIAKEPRDYRAYFAERIRTQTAEFKIWVAESPDDYLLGWQSLLPTRNNPAILNFMAESSTYVRVDNKYKGVGTAVMRHALKQAEGTKLQWASGFALASNLPMLKVAYSLGWKEVGRVPTALKPPISDDLLFLVYQVPAQEIER
jgi:L-amino acid N-acyltransferase YncA